MRTHFCGEVTERLDGESVAVCGWLHRRRDHGGVIFIDLRDRSGLLQIVIDPDTPEAFALADRARNEYVLRVAGRVRFRPEGTENPELATGRVEVLARTIEVLNESRTPPVPARRPGGQRGDPAPVPDTSTFAGPACTRTCGSEAR